MLLGIENNNYLPKHSIVEGLHEFTFVDLVLKIKVMQNVKKNVWLENIKWNQCVTAKLFCQSSVLSVI